MRKAVLVCSLTLLSATAAQAQWGPGGRQDRREVRQDRRELRQDQRQIQDDVRDAQRMEFLLQQFDAARASRVPAQIAEVDRRVQFSIDRELRESSRELMQKEAEANRSAREVGRDRRDPAYGQRWRGPGPGPGVRDDIRDARDDRRDARREAYSAGWLQNVQREYAALSPRFDPPALDRRRQLIAQLVQMQHAEIREGVREIREDRREIREDRRDRRWGPQ